MFSFQCFYRQQLPIPGSDAQAVVYPACEWRLVADSCDDTTDWALHPMNRFVCSWLTSDMTQVSRCDEVLSAFAQIKAGERLEWFVDGDAFLVDMAINGVQFNPAHVGPQDVAYWNQPSGRFALEEVHALLLEWRNFLVKPASSTHGQCD